MNLAAVAETHLELRGMGVDVDQLRIEGQVQHVARVPPVIQHVAIGESHGVHQQAVTHTASVDEPELLVRLCARARWQACPTGQHHRPGRVAHRDRRRREVLPHDFLEPRQVRCRLAHGGHVEEYPRAVAQPKAHVEARQRHALDQAHDVRELGRVAPDKFAPRRHVKEQVAHLDGGPGRVSGGAHRAQRSPLDRKLRPLSRAGGARGDAQPRHRADRGQRLAAEAERRDRRQIIERGDLAGGVAGECQGQLRCADPAPVIAHPNEAHAAALDVDLDSRGARIEGVLNQLLDDRGRPLDDLAGGDLVNELAGKHANGHRPGSVQAIRRGHGGAGPDQGVVVDSAPAALASVLRRSCLKRVPSGGFCAK